MASSASSRAFESFHHRALLGFAAALTTGKTYAASDRLSAPPARFSSAQALVNGTSLHVARGGRGPAVILVHDFAEDTGKPLRQECDDIMHEALPERGVDLINYPNAQEKE